MRIQVNFRNIKPSRKVAEHAKERFSKAAKYLIKRGRGELFLTREGHEFQVEVTFYTGGQPIHARGSGENLFAAIEEAVFKMNRQGKRVKEKVQQKDRNFLRSREERIRYLQAKMLEESHYDIDEDEEFVAKAA